MSYTSEATLLDAKSRNVVEPILFKHIVTIFTILFSKTKNTHVLLILFLPKKKSINRNIIV